MEEPTSHGEEQRPLPRTSDCLPPQKSLTVPGGQPAESLSQILKNKCVRYKNSYFAGGTYSLIDSAVLCFT